MARRLTAIRRRLPRLFRFEANRSRRSAGGQDYTAAASYFEVNIAQTGCSFLRLGPTMRIRPAVLKLHRWLALAAMVPLTLLGLTGAVLTFENELDHVLNPTLWSVAAGGQRVDWQTVLDGVRRKYPSDRMLRYGSPPARPCRRRYPWPRGCSCIAIPTMARFAVQDAARKS